MDDGLDVPGYVRRVRRLADLSQRELATRLGLSRAQVARLETGERTIDVGAFEAILARAGLHLQVVDASGAPVAPVPRDVLRDHAQRHFPSHLDVLGPDDLPAHRGANPRKGRPDAKGWYTLRGRRMEQRDLCGTQPDHPTRSGLRKERLDRWAVMRAAAAERIEADPLDEVCTCPDACFDGLCVPSCACQCEPDRDVFGHPRHDV